MNDEKQKMIIKLEELVALHEKQLARSKTKVNEFQFGDEQVEKMVKDYLEN